MEQRLGDVTKAGVMYKVKGDDAKAYKGKQGEGEVMNV